MRSGHAWHDRHLGYFFVLPATLMLAAVLIFPAFITLKASITPEGGSGWNLTLTHYQKAFRDPVLWQTFKNTVAFVAWSLAGHFVLGLGLALALNQALPGQTFFRLVALIPWTIPDVVAGILFRWVLNPIHGAMNPLIRMILPSFPAEFQWLSSPTLAFPSVIIANVWRGYPLVMVMLLAGLMAIPRELYEAAAVDGASAWRRFVHVTLPGLAPTFLFVGVTTMIGYFQLFAEPYVMTQGGPLRATTSVVLMMYEEGFRWWRMGTAAAIAFLLLLVTLVGTLIQMWLQRRRA